MIYHVLPKYAQFSSIYTFRMSTLSLRLNLRFLMPTEKSVYTKRGLISVKTYEGYPGDILVFFALQSKETFTLATGIGSEVFPGRRNHESWKEEG